MLRNSLISFSSKRRPLNLISSLNTTSSFVSPLNSISSYSSTIPQSPFSPKLGFRLPSASPLLSRSGFSSSTLDATTTSSCSVVSRDVLGAVSHYGKCYWDLSKVKLSMLVVATSGTGYVLGSGNVIDLAGLCWTCGGTMMVAASANSLNQVFEVKNDAKMKRTMRRPLPSGRMTIPHALAWATSVGVAGTYLLTCKTNALAAGLAASNLILYAFVYTPLKQIHPVNTWVGAIVGAIPPLLGWAAASGEISLNGMILPAALYFWQLPHFMALAYMCRDDYAAGGYKMLSLFDATGRRTALVALRNCLYLIPLGYLAYQWGLTSGWFCLESSLLTLAIGSTALSFYFDRTTKNARRMFFASLLYLPVFMSGLILHRLSNDWPITLKNESDSTSKVASISPSLTFEQDNSEHEEHRVQEKNSRIGVRGRGRPPVAYASVAPFPFLPAPCYAES